MKRFILATLMLASAGSLALADNSLPAKAMKDAPGVTGAGTTANPTAKPETGGLAEKAMQDAPGVTGAGTTANPTAKPDAKGLAEKAMQDHPGIKQQ